MCCLRLTRVRWPTGISRIQRAGGRDADDRDVSAPTGRRNVWPHDEREGAVPGDAEGRGIANEVPEAIAPETLSVIHPTQTCQPACP